MGGNYILHLCRHQGTKCTGQLRGGEECSRLMHFSHGFQAEGGSPENTNTNENTYTNKNRNTTGSQPEPGLPEYSIQSIINCLASLHFL